MTDEQIKHMTERFLSWKLPADFNPDCGISAQRPNYGPNVAWEPMGTNLLDYTQAEAMVRHMVEGLSASSPNHADTGLGDWSVDGSIYENMEACVVKGGARDGRTYAHCWKYADALELVALLNGASIPDLERMDAMREALEFYADESAWNQPPIKTRETELGTAYENQASKVRWDRGRIARKALSGDKA